MNNTSMLTAKLATMSYDKQHMIQAGAEHYEVNSKQFYIMKIKDVTHIIIRGTEFNDIKDIWTNIQIKFKKTTNGKIHTGFEKAALDIHKLIYKKIKNTKINKLVISGHSLGGAIALLLATKLKKYKPTVYTFGAPNICNKEFRNNHRDIITHNFKNCGDPIPRLIFWMSTIGDEYYLEHNGTITKNPVFFKFRHWFHFSLKLDHPSRTYYNAIQKTRKNHGS